LRLLARFVPYIAAYLHKGYAIMSSRVVVAILALQLTGFASAHAQEADTANAAQNPRWTAIRAVFGQGEQEDGYFRVNLPRSDLHVSIGRDTLSPRFEFTSYIGFAPAGAKSVIAMSEIIVLQSEVPLVLAEAHRQGIHITAVHNHLLNEQPHIMYVHATAEGAPGAIASGFKAVFARTATPLAPAEEEKSTVDWSRVDAVLGAHAEAHGTIAEYVFPRREHLTMHGMPLKSSGTLETASEVVFEQLGDGRVANTGELFIAPNEVEPVVRALDENGLHVTALHNHMVEDQPRMYWVHWYATGDAATLAKGVAVALSHMNSVQKSKSEGGG
jgi:hypothetical protein